MAGSATLVARRRLSQKDLADQIFKDQPNTARILDKLQQKGVIRRALSLSDRRSFIIYLTAAGNLLRKRLLPVVAGVVHDAFQGVDEDQQQLLKELLLRVCGNLKPPD